jgi:cellobiose-specific phosphotransferase system component IIA
VYFDFIMTSQEKKLVEFLCTLRQTAAQLIEATHNAYNYALESAPSTNFDEEDQQMVNSWQDELKEAHKRLNENEL